MEPANRATVPALMVSAKTQALMADVFRRDDLFVGFSRIETRVAAWGRGAEPKRLAHAAAIVSERELLERLRPSGLDIGDDIRPDWTILASRPLPASTVEHRFGSRVAAVSTVEMTKEAGASTCWSESLREGWLFLMPGASEKGWLLAVGGARDLLLAESRLVAEQISSVGDAADQFSAYPMLADPLCGLNWLACGSAALTFDPLCGDGTGNAIREAILAVAVVRAVACGAEEEQLREHYRTRLLAAFLRHLEICREFYTTGYGGPWWDGEVARLDEGIAFCTRQLANAKPFRYRLGGFELHAV